MVGTGSSSQTGVVGWSQDLLVEREAYGGAVVVSLPPVEPQGRGGV